MRTFASTVFLGLVCPTLIASTLASQPVTTAPESYEPYSRTASAITGSITISKSALTFSNNAIANLEIISESVEGDWGFNDKIVSAQLFKITSNPGVLLNDNILCGKDSPPTFLAVYQENVSGGLLRLAVFSGKVPPTSIHSDNLCGTYNYQ